VDVVVDVEVVVVVMMGDTVGHMESDQ